MVDSEAFIKRNCRLHARDSISRVQPAICVQSGVECGFETGFETGFEIGVDVAFESAQVCELVSSAA
jgi:hypothetical protein